MVSKTIAILTLLLLTGAASGATVWLEAPATVPAGGQFQVAVMGDFGDFGFHAGGMRLHFAQELVEVEAFQFELSIDWSLSCPGAAVCPDDPAGTYTLIWGNHLISPIAPGAGPTLMGTLTMLAGQSPGILDLHLTDFSSFTGGWFGDGFITQPTPTLVGTSVSIVPLPGAIWLMLGAMGVLARRRNPSAAGCN